MSDERRNPSQGAGHEPVSVNIRGLVVGIAGLTVLIVLSLWAMWELAVLLTSNGEQDRGETAFESPAQMTARTVLEPDQRAQRIRYEANQNTLLNSYEWLDGEGRVARIPIDRAMQIVKQRYRSSTEEDKQ